jgi:hypothetical protein
MMARGSTLLCGSLLAVASGAHAQGYFSFGDIPGLDVQPSVEIDLNPAMLSFLGEAAKGGEGEAAAALEGITNVRVYVYEGISDDVQDVLKFVDDTSQSLERDGWHNAVRVREDGEQVRVFIKPAAAGGANAGTIEGLTMMVTDTGGSDEAVFINIAGIIQPAQLGRIAAAIGMDGMFSVLPGAAGSVVNKGSAR